MRRILFSIFTLLLPAAACFFLQGTEPLPRLQVSPDGHFLQTTSGKPFFYLADTAWELFHRVNRADTLLYLDTRAQQGFNVVQAVLLAEYNGLTEPNPEGDTPLVDNNPATPNEKYFKYIDWVVGEAAKRRLFIGILPTWGDKVRKDWGIGPVVFNAANARTYGHFLGARYRSASNIIWIVGGDRRADGQEDIWRALVAGLQEGDGGSHLITYHPAGGLSSSKFWLNESWLSFHMLQSSHGKRDIANYSMVSHDYALTPPKPVIDGELRYEDHPVNWKPELGYFNDFDVRQGVYWAVFSGAAGTTYGCNDIWQFFSSAHPPIGSARTSWKQALQLPGANQMRFVKQLMLSRDYFPRVPDQSLLAQNTEGAGYQVATRGKNYVFVYSPLGEPIHLKLGALPGRKLTATWFDPRSGMSRPSASINNEGEHSFTPPGTPERGNDWVLVLDSAD
jgi:hypothetical protein